MYDNVSPFAFPPPAQLAALGGLPDGLKPLAAVALAVPVVVVLDGSLDALKVFVVAVVVLVCMEAYADGRRSE